MARPAFPALSEARDRLGVSSGGVSSGGVAGLGAAGSADFHDRLRALVGEQSIREYAKRLGVNYQTVANYLTGTTEPNRAVLDRIAQLHDVRLDWLVAGRGPMRDGAAAAGDAGDSAAQVLGRRLGLEPVGWGGEIVQVPVYEVRVSAGPGSGLAEERPSDYMAFDHRFLAQIRANPSSLVVVTVSGDSAEPTLEEGSLVLVDRSRTQPRDGGLYVLRIGDDLFLKRVQPLASGGLRLISDNPVYPPDEVGEADLPRVHIIGRVAWPPVPVRR